MTISITGKHVELGESLTQFIETEVHKITKNHMNDDVETTVTVSKDHHMFRTDISVHVSKSFIVFCQGSDADAYKSAANAVEKLEKQIVKYRTRLRDRKRKEGEGARPIAAYYVIDSAHEDEGQDTPVVIAEMEHEIPHITVSDAVMKLDLGSKTMVIFKNRANDAINVVYRRPDGNIGWIDPTKKVVSL